MSAKEQKGIIVTGGGTGIGRAITETFAAAGMLVLITGRREAPLKEVCEKYPENVFHLVADITDSTQRNRIVPLAKERMGRLDTLVNNAGLLRMGNLVDSTDEDFEDCWATNLVAPAGLMRDAVPLLAESKGSIVNISSVTGRAHIPGTGAYGSTKAALHHLSTICAIELGPLGIRVNAVSPGATRTDMGGVAIDAFGERAFEQMTPLQRVGIPSDIAKAVFYVASEDAGWVTGQVIEASGGMSL